VFETSKALQKVVDKVEKRKVCLEKKIKKKQ